MTDGPTGTASNGMVNPAPARPPPNYQPNQQGQIVDVNDPSISTVDRAWFSGQGAHNPYQNSPLLGPGAPSYAATAAPPAPAASTLDPSTALQPGQANISGIDMSQPGAAEQYFTDNGSRFTAPTAMDNWMSQNGGALGTPGTGETFAQTAMGQYGNGNNPHASNDAEQAYQNFLGSTPANVNPYYDYASDQLSNSMNTQLAARGAYGSSVGLNSLGTGMADLNAQRANAQAAYGLNWANTGGTLARGADTSSAASAANELNWMNGLGAVANNGEQDSLARLGLGGNLAATQGSQDLNWLQGGMNAAIGAQTAQSTRGQNAFNNEFMMGTGLSNIMGDTYNQMFQTDPTIFGQQVGLPIAAAGDNVADAKYSGEENRKTIDDVTGGLTAYAKAKAAADAAAKAGGSS